MEEYEQEVLLTLHAAHLVALGWQESSFPRFPASQCDLCQRYTHWSRPILAVVWGAGYQRGLRDESGDLEPAVNPFDPVV